MAEPQVSVSSEQDSRRVTEASRQTEWERPSFLRELFLGRFRLDLVHPFPSGGEERREFVAFREALTRLLRERVDAVAIDAAGEYPEGLVDELRRIGAFGMKIPQEYGGLGLSTSEYCRVMELLGSVDANVTALLSAHQSIGVPRPVELFGTAEQKREFLPRCARGEISGFALTELEAGSDPARLTTTAEPTADGSAYLLNGRKLWCTNGTFASLLVVMAKNPANGKISAFVVETSRPGVQVEQRCRFMGHRAIGNALIGFTDVRVPKANLLGREGQGLRIALTTLNAGRLAIPAAAVGTAKLCLEVCRRWAGERVQWGRPIGRHEAISHRLADMAATTFAMESVSRLACGMADSADRDIRLEAAGAKEWCSSRTWQIVDDTMQIRGGRGYETASSLAARGEDPIPVEMVMRDFRINRIFEGSSEIMHLFMARELVDRHLQVAGDLIDPEKPIAARARAFFARALPFYAWWYPSRWLGWSLPPRFAGFGRLARHLRFVDRTGRRLARQTFHAMVRFGAALEHRQGLLFRLVDVANELLAMAASVSRARALAAAGSAPGERAVDLADLFCRSSRRRVKTLLDELWHNDDARRHRAGIEVMAGREAWLEHGSLPLAERLPLPLPETIDLTGLVQRPEEPPTPLPER